MNNIKLFQNNSGRHVLHLNGVDISSAVNKVVIEVTAHGYAVARVDLAGKIEVDIDGVSLEFTYAADRDGQEDE